MATKKLGLTRDQLASFLSDHEKVKQFENLFRTTNELIDITDGTVIEAGGALANANIALDLVQKLAQDSAIGAAVADIKAEEALSQIDNLQKQTSIDLAFIENKANHVLTLLDKVSKDVEGLQMIPPPREFKRSRYGSFYDTTTQTATVINTAKAITFNTTDLSRGVYIGSPTSRVYVDTDGIYNFQTSIQLDSTVATAEIFYLWFRLNGVDVTNSASQVRVQGNNAEIFVALNYFFDLKAGDYVELMFSVSNLGVQLLASGAVAPHPGIPSIILTVSNNIGGIQ
jgi:hypothetical protein